MGSYKDKTLKNTEGGWANFSAPLDFQEPESFQLHGGFAS